MGFGSKKKTATQQAAPARIGTSVMSALPQARMTIHKVRPAPMHTGSSRIATMNLAHFGTGAEFRNQNSEASRKPGEEIANPR